MGAPAAKRTDGILCCAVFSADAGFAWQFIETLFARVGDRFAARGVDTWVAYPQLSTRPRALLTSRARPVELPLDLASVRAILRVARFMAARRIKVLYLPDRPAWHPAYALFRVVGVRSIVVHDHTSGSRVPGKGVRGVLKRVSRQIRSMYADRVVVVSDFVRERMAAVESIPEDHIVRVWNGIDDIDQSAQAAKAEAVRAEFGLSADRPVVFWAGRMVVEKGVFTLLRSFDVLVSTWPHDRPRPALILVGDGPARKDLDALRAELWARDDIVMTGYRDKAADIGSCATIAVVPSLWQEAFGLAALEPMMRGKPVIASRVGGLPEIVADGETGVLVPPGDERALCEAMRNLLLNPRSCIRLGANGRRRAREHFSMTRQLDELTEVLEMGLDLD